MEGIWLFFFGPGYYAFRWLAVAALLSGLCGIFGSLIYLLLGTYYITFRKLIVKYTDPSKEEQEMWAKVSKELNDLSKKYSITDDDRKVELANELAHKYGYVWNEEKGHMIKEG